MEVKIFNRDKISEESIKDKIIRVKAIIVNSKSEIMLGEAFGTIQFPGGHLEENETLNDGLRREMLEETGISIKGIHEPFLAIKHFIKDKVGDNNRALEIYYFKIFTDESFHMENVHLDDQETAGDFHLFYVPLKDVKKLLKKTINDNPRNELITEEMLIALKEWRKTNG